MGHLVESVRRFAASFGGCIHFFIAADALLAGKGALLLDAGMAVSVSVSVSASASASVSVLVFVSVSYR